MMPHQFRLQLWGRYQKPRSRKQFDTCSAALGEPQEEPQEEPQLHPAHKPMQAMTPPETTVLCCKDKRSSWIS
ncbi:unnamed protein product [Arctogadus glacialis]